jgi:hypothetical protein
MLANLAKAAKERVNRKRASVAQAILKATEAKPQAAEAAFKTDGERPSAHVAQSPQQTIYTARSKIWQSAKAGFRKLANHIYGSLKGNRFLRPAHQRVRST